MHKRSFNLSPLFPVLENIVNDVANSSINDLSKKRHPLTFRPKANIIENANNYKLVLTVPGFEREDIKIKVEGKALIISSDKSVDQEQKYAHSEYIVGSFERKFFLPEHVDLNNIKANMENGLLLITLQKEAEAQPKEIIIQ